MMNKTEIPENIHITEYRQERAGTTVLMPRLCYNDGKQALIPASGSHGVQTIEHWPDQSDKFVLKPCDGSDLSYGDVAFFDNAEPPFFDKLRHYCMILNDEYKRVVPDDLGGLDIRGTSGFKWWKVVPREEI